MTLWSTGVAIVRRPTRRSYKIKRGHVRYGNKWIPLDKFRNLEVFEAINKLCFSSLFPVFFFRCDSFVALESCYDFFKMRYTCLYVDRVWCWVRSDCFLSFIRMSRMLFTIIMMASLSDWLGRQPRHAGPAVQS